MGMIGGSDESVVSLDALVGTEVGSLCDEAARQHLTPMEAAREESAEDAFHPGGHGH